ncbi:GNAT family N-acetyltransferase [Sediminibacillus massiliensis]|uniref:GNAT family N-acetyltransferase n=1 Tax=Sediminibacillus massiliensis TaxID=1926277 RepID=UPI00098887A0|nr:GNAT family N-acetyltransferase [Sediminibacillus massiliensis]
MNPVIIKPRVEHTEAIAAICANGWKQTVNGKLSEEYQNKNIDFWYSHDKVSHDIREGNYTHAALFENKIAGVIGGGITKPGRCEVFVLYVDENQRYQGIGSLLLDALTEQQLEQGATEQWVSVQEGNQFGIPFYEARGFSFKQRKVSITETDEERVSLRYSRFIGT